MLPFLSVRPKGVNSPKFGASRATRTAGVEGVGGNSGVRDVRQPTAIRIRIKRKTSDILRLYLHDELCMIGFISSSGQSPFFRIGGVFFQ